MTVFSSEAASDTNFPETAENQMKTGKQLPACISPKNQMVALQTEVNTEEEENFQKRKLSTGMMGIIWKYSEVQSFMIRKT